MRNVIKGALSLAAMLLLSVPAVRAADTRVPHFKVDPSWPQLPLPNNWTLGELGGIFVDAQDHIWIIHRPKTLTPWEKAAATTPPRGGCCIPAPPVVEFDSSGKLLRAWGGPGEGHDWPTIEHGITVDYKGFVWVGGSATRDRPNEPADGMVLKFTQDGKFVMEIGHPGMSKGNTDTTQLSGAADMTVDPKTNEIYIADGYGNRRVIVFDADTGQFKRMWGAYGKPPINDKPAPFDPAQSPPDQFRLVHAVNLSKDGLVYVGDRDNDRLQIFKKDGTFIAEHIYRKETFPPGSVGSIAFWPDRDQSILALADLGNFQVRLVRRSDGAELGAFGHYGNFVGQLGRLHQLAFDSHGNLYTAETPAKRVQKWVPDIKPAK